MDILTDLGLVRFFILLTVPTDKSRANVHHRVIDHVRHTIKGTASFFEDNPFTNYPYTNQSALT